MEQQHQSAIDNLLDRLSPEEIAILIAKRRQAKLHAEERAKQHSMSAFRLPEAQWADLKAHALDGGGVDDDTDLRRILHQALLSDDQTVFWPELFHWLKHRLRERGNVRALPHGGVAHSGVHIP